MSRRTSANAWEGYYSDSTESSSDDDAAEDHPAASTEPSSTPPVSKKPTKKSAPHPMVVDDDIAAAEAEGEDSDDELSQRLQQQGPDPLYDVDADDKDAKWVQRRRAKHANGAANPTKSDAMLSCPGCFSLLCIDCQRHTKFYNQYRAMFVQNCQVSTTQRVRAAEDGETFQPIMCSTCGTEVGVMDRDQVFHFFHVLPSES